MQEATKLWCLCRQPYNEDRPMLACDYCQDWFHYDCVGLRAPSEDEDDDDVAPKDFKCPSCCRKVLLGFLQASWVHLPDLHYRIVLRIVHLAVLSAWV